MKDYFKLQYTMLNRHLWAFGLHPILGYILGIALFVGASVLVFVRTDYAVYIYMAVALSSVAKLSEPQRNDFLKIGFTDVLYLQLRIIENSLIALPFILFLAYKLLWLYALGLGLSAILMARFNFSTQISTTMPTPFYKYPYEFVVGFRQTFYIIGLAYFLTIMALVVGNFNLGVSAQVLVFLVCLSYYANPEAVFYVWSYSLSPQQFLRHKFIVAMAYATLLTSPIIIALLICYPQYWYIMCAFQVLGYLAILAMLLAKYAAFPNEINLPQSVLLALGLMMPPALIVIMIIFYRQSINRLSVYLK